MIPFQHNPPGFDGPLIQNGAQFAIDVLERFGELLPAGFTDAGIVGGWGGKAGTHEQALELVYAGLRQQAAAGEIKTAAVFSLGEDAQGRDLLVCFAESADAGAFRNGAILTWSKRPWSLPALGLILRRGQFSLFEDEFRPIERRIWPPADAPS